MICYLAAVTEVFTTLPLQMGSTGRYFWCAAVMSAVWKSTCKASVVF